MSESIQSLVASGKLKVVPLKSDTLTEQNALLELSALGFRSAKAGRQDVEDAVCLVISALQGYQD